MGNEAHPGENRRKAARSRWQGGSGLALTLLALSLMGLHANIASAQSLNWEGQTGIFVTPTAYLAPSGAKGFGTPVVAYHYADGGQVLGGFNQASITLGGFDRLEFGYTRGLHQEGSTTGLSNLWSGGFNIFHGKLNLLNEKDTKQGWLPSISIGFVARTQVRNVGGVMQGKDTTNADFYVVATKSVTQIRKLPLVFNLGYKATNASYWGWRETLQRTRAERSVRSPSWLKVPKRSTRRGRLRALAAAAKH